MSARFADYLRTVGRGAHLSRPLSREEAREAMTLVLDGEAAPVQIGAFLLVLRYRGETPAEIAGFVDAVRARLPADPGLSPDLDWPSYADRHKQLPWFTLAAVLLAGAGVRVLMHGIPGEGPATTPAALAALGIAPARTLAEAGEQLERTAFAYLPLSLLSPELAGLFALRPLLGLRTPVHTLARELAPFAPKAQIQGIFHPTYLELHHETQRLLGQQRAITFKGGGGEAQRNPDKPCRTLVHVDGASFAEEWPEWRYGDPHPWRQEPLEVGRIRALWEGELDLPGPRAAVLGTTALALRILGRAAAIEEAEAMAAELWRTRHARPSAVARSLSADE
ncbi:Bifunctional protein TrpGD [bacterium HR40]|nr:Bifunctional protein TrpGD [bacterium HR40]